MLIETKKVTPQVRKLFKAMIFNDMTITAREAMLDLDMTSATLSRRICDMEQLGFGIERVRRKNPVSGKRYTRYIIREMSEDVELP